MLLEEVWESIEEDEERENEPSKIENEVQEIVEELDLDMEGKFCVQIDIDTMRQENIEVT